MVKKKAKGNKRSKTVVSKKQDFDEVQVGTSLPPSVDGQLRCFLRVTVTKILWAVDQHPANVMVRLKWWGEEGTGVIFRPVDPRQDFKDANGSKGFPPTSRHPVCSGPKQFAAYLKDMGTLVLDVVSGIDLIGRVLITEIGNLSASHPIHGFFPVMPVGTNAKKVADLYVAIKFESVSAIYNRLSSSVPTVDTVYDRHKVSDQSLHDLGPSPPPQLKPVSPVTHPRNTLDDDHFESPASLKGITFSSAVPQKHAYSYSTPRLPSQHQGQPLQASSETQPFTLSPKASGGREKLETDKVRGASVRAERRSSVKDDNQQPEIAVDLIGELLDRGNRLRHAMAVSSQDEEDDPLLSSPIVSSHIQPGGLLREILIEDSRRKKLTYPEDKDDSTLDDALPEIERKTVDLLLGDELSYVDRLPLSSSDDSVVSEPDDPLHDDSLLKDLFYTTKGVRESDSEITISTDDDDDDDDGDDVDRSEVTAKPTENTGLEGAHDKFKKKKVKNTAPVNRAKKEQSLIQRRESFSVGYNPCEQTSSDISMVNNYGPNESELTAGNLREQSAGQPKATIPMRMADFVDSLGVEKLTALGRINSARVELDKFSFAHSDVSKEALPLTGTYFVEYHFPVVTSSKDKERRVDLATELTRVASKKVLNQAVHFNHHCVFPVLFNSSIVDYWWNKSLLFKVFHRDPGHRTPSLIGVAGLPLRSVLQSPSLHHRADVDVRHKMESDVVGRTRTSGSSSTELESRTFPHRSSDTEQPLLSTIGALMVEVGLLADGTPVHISPRHTAKPPFPISSKLREDPFSRPSGLPSTTLTSNNREQLKWIEIVKHNSTSYGSQTLKKTGGEQPQEPIVDHGNDTVVLHTLLWIPEGRGVALQVSDNYVNQEMVTAVGGNPYLVCRMFWSEDTSRSQVCWGTATPQFGFKQTVPVLLMPAFLQRACNNFMVIEVLDKTTPPVDDKLVGLVKLPLHQFYLSFRDPRVMKMLMKSKYPVIAVDSWCSITSPFTGTVHGQLKILLAMGTMEQVSALQILKTEGEFEQKLSCRPEHHLDNYRDGVETAGNEGHGNRGMGIVEHQFEVTVEDIRGLSIFGNTVHGETDCFVQYHFPRQTDQAMEDKNFDELPRLQAHRTSTTLCVPDPSFHDVARHTFVLPAGVPVQKHLLAAFSGSWVSVPQGPRSGVMSFELWRRFYYPNVRDQLVAKASLPLAKLCAMVTMQKQGEASSQTFSLSLMGVVPVIDRDTSRQTRPLDTGLLDLTIKYRKTTFSDSRFGNAVQEDHICLAVDIMRACGLKTAASDVATHNTSMAYPADVGVNAFVVVKLPFGRRPEYRTRTVARTFAPEFTHHTELVLPMMFRVVEEGITCSLAEMLETTEAVFEIWHETVKTSVQDFSSARRSKNILLGVAKVPLIKLLTNRTGIKGWQALYRDTSLTSGEETGSQRQSPKFIEEHKAVGGLELNMKFTEAEDRERIINRARSMGWAPLPGIESDEEKLLEGGIDGSSQSSSNKMVDIQLNVNKAWIPLSLLERVGAPDKHRKDTVAYTRYKFYDQCAICSGLSKLCTFDDKNKLCKLRHSRRFTVTENAALVWYMREELLEVQVWLSHKAEKLGKESGSILPRKRDKLVGAAFIDMSPLVEQRKKELRLSGIFPLMKAGAPQIDGAYVHVQIVVAKPGSSLHHWDTDKEIILSDCNNSSDGIESNESSSDYDADVTASTSTAHDQVHETAENKDRVDANNENESFPAHVTIDQALHLPLVIDARGNRVKPNTFVSYQLPIAASPVCTSIIRSSINPTWEYQKLERFCHDMLTTQHIIFKVWHRPESCTEGAPSLSKEADNSNGSSLPTGDKVMGCATVDISPLKAGLRQLVGWYNIVGVSGEPRGQIKVGVCPVVAVSPSRTLASTSTAFGSQAVDLPGISLSYKPPSAAHLEINSEREENLPQQGERDSLGALSNQIHAYEETLRKLRLARGSGTSSGQPDVDPVMGTKQTDSSCSQSFLFSQLRKNITELDKLHENLKAKLNSEDSHQPENIVKSTTESVAYLSDKNESFARGIGEKETVEQEIENKQSEKHFIVSSEVKTGKTIISTKRSSEESALTAHLGVNMVAGTDSTNATNLDFEEPLNRKYPEAEGLLFNLGTAQSNVPLSKPDSATGGAEPQNSDESENLSSCGEDVDSLEETSPLNDNMTKFRRYMDEKDSWLSSDDDEMKEENDTRIVQQPLDGVTASAHPEVINAIRYVTNLHSPPSGHTGMPDDPKLDFEKEEKDNCADLHERRLKHDCESDWDSVENGGRADTEDESDVKFLAFETNAVGKVVERSNDPSLVHVSNHTGRSDSLKHFMDEGYLGGSVGEMQESLSDNLLANEQRGEAQTSLPNFFMPSKQLEQSMRAIRLGATAQSTGDQHAVASSSLLDRVNKTEIEQRQMNKDKKLSSEFAKRELSYNVKKKCNPQISTAEAERIAKIFGAKIT